MDRYEDKLTFPVKTLDLRTTKCPLNFVQAKLALEKLAVGQILEVWVATEGESATNIPNSMRQEGQGVVNIMDEPDKRRIWIERKQ